MSHGNKQQSGSAIEKKYPKRSNARPLTTYNVSIPPSPPCTNVQNMFALLGNDVEDETDSIPKMPKEVVKSTTTSKKADVPPPSADPAKAKKKKAATGNDAALKSKNDNKANPGPASTPGKHEKKPFDRHSRSNKTDSKKKVRQGWGDDRRELDYEKRAEEDAAAEAAQTPEPAAPAGKSLQEYLAEQSASPFAASKSTRKANEGAEDKWTSSEKIEKEQQEFFAATAGKKQRARNTKEKKFLDFNAVFADEAPKFNDKKAFKGKRSAKPAAKSSAAAPTEQNFPSL